MTLAHPLRVARSNEFIKKVAYGDRPSLRPPAYRPNFAYAYFAYLYEILIIFFTITMLIYEMRPMRGYN